MFSRSRPWLGAVLALFFVAVLPMCWFGALERAVVATDAVPPNNNEEREEDFSKESKPAIVAQGRPDAPPPPLETVQRATPIVHVTYRLVDSKAHVPHPLRLTNRRLI